MKCTQCGEDIGLELLAGLVIEFNGLMFCSILCADSYTLGKEENDNNEMSDL